MEFIDSHVPKECTIRLTCDWQVGSVSTSTAVIDKIMEPVYERKDYRLALLGDLWDNITPQDKRYSSEDIDPKYPTGSAQRKFVESILRPAKNKIISLGMGNHEHTSTRSDGDPTLEMAERLGVPYGGYSAMVRVNKEFQMLLWHGRPSLGGRAGSPFQKRLAIKRRLVQTNRDRWPEAEGFGKVKLFAQGHVNQLEVVRPEESLKLSLDYDWDSGEITSTHENADSAWFAACGSAQRLFVKGKTTYAEAGGYTPLSLGCVDVHVKNSKIVDVEAIRLG